jgi:hypothetical protein|tara:strand:- start:694 stop:906 length:213 start_codon:yes stop_codon:yes gene_type:complete
MMSEDADVSSGDIWLADDLVDNKDLELMDSTSQALDYDIGKVRAFVVALLQAVDDRIAASKVNEVLIGSE